MSGERFKDKAFLKWAKDQGGNCCVCRAISGEFYKGDELHHFDYVNRGTGMKGRDHWTCRVCFAHHAQIQGKGRRWFVENSKLETWTAMLEDALNLLSDYVLEMKAKGKGAGHNAF